MNQLESRIPSLRSRFSHVPANFWQSGLSSLLNSTASGVNLVSSLVIWADAIQSEHVVWAMADIEAKGLPSGRGESLNWELIHEGKSLGNHPSNAELKAASIFAKANSLEHRRRRVPAELLLQAANDRVAKPG